MVKCCWYLSACLTKNCLLKKHKGGLLVLSILWFSLLLLARYTPGLVRINFDRRWYALLRPRCPSVHRCFSACFCRIQICCRLDTIRKLPGHQWLCGVTSFWLGKHSKAVGVSKIQKGEKVNGACIHQRIHKHWMALQGWDVEFFFIFPRSSKWILSVRVKKMLMYVNVLSSVDTMPTQVTRIRCQPTNSTFNRRILTWASWSM